MTRALPLTPTKAVDDHHVAAIAARLGKTPAQVPTPAPTPTPTLPLPLPVPLPVPLLLALLLPYPYA